MRGGRFNWPSFTLDEERALAEKAKRMNGVKQENGTTEGGFEDCAVPTTMELNKGAEELETE